MFFFYLSVIYLYSSFNAGAAAEGDAQARCVINTYLSLCACVMSAFALSSFLAPDRKFVMEHIQNATLAGYVPAILDLKHEFSE